MAEPLFLIALSTGANALLIDSMVATHDALKMS